VLISTNELAANEPAELQGICETLLGARGPLLGDGRLTAWLGTLQACNVAVAGDTGCGNSCQSKKPSPWLLLALVLNSAMPPPRTLAAGSLVRRSLPGLPGNSVGESNPDCRCIDLSGLSSRLLHELPSRPLLELARCCGRGGGTLREAEAGKTTGPSGCPLIGVLGLGTTYLADPGPGDTVRMGPHELAEALEAG